MSSSFALSVRFEYKQFFISSRLKARFSSPHASSAMRSIVALFEMPRDFASSAFTICAFDNFLWDLKY